MSKTRWWIIACAVLALGGAAFSDAAAQPAADRPIVVKTAKQLIAALVPANAGRTILVQAGTYAVDRSLSVPDGATLQGEGMMLGVDLPAGFAQGTETRIVALSGVAGNFLTLGNGASLRDLVIEDVQRQGDSRGNTVAVVSRNPGDAVAAAIVECQIVQPNGPGRPGLDGPTGGAIVALTLNPKFGADPAHEGAAVGVAVRRSIVRAAWRSLFAMNFASRTRLDVELTQNVVGGTLEAIGAIARPDLVEDAATTISSSGNVYSRGDFPDFGWQIGGGSSAPLGGTAGTRSNEVRVSSIYDRIEGAGAGIYAFAARRHTSTDGPSFDNTVDLVLQGLAIRTVSDGADLLLFGARTGFEGPTPDREFTPGDRNVLTVDMRGSSGSGRRANEYADVGGATLPENFGEGNRLRFVGTRAQFERSNTDINPAPLPSFFVGG